MTGRWMALLLTVVAVSGVGQTLSGTWSGEVSLLPTPALRSTALSLVYAEARWSVTSRSEFSSLWGWAWQEFDAHAQFGPLGIEGTALFGPLIPDFLYAQVVAHAEFGGAKWGLHTALLGPTLGGPLGGAVLTASVPVGQGVFTAAVGFGASLPEDGFTIWHVSGLSRTYATDPRPGGLSFTQAEISLTGLSLCCGVTYDVELSFTKAGLQHVEFTVKSLPLCCGIRLDAAVKFTVTAKQVSLTPHLEGIGTACLVVYGDVRYQNHTWEGIEIYGWKLRCQLSACAYVEFLTAFSVARVEEILDEDIFVGTEFEYVKLGFCGPGCCGGRYAVDVAIYFVPTGAHLGIHRVTVATAVPLSAGFTLKAKFATPGELVVGWTVAF